MPKLTVHNRWLHIRADGQVKVYTQRRHNPEPGVVVVPLVIRVPAIDERSPITIDMPAVAMEVAVAV